MSPNIHNFYILLFQVAGKKGESHWQAMGYKQSRLLIMISIRYIWFLRRRLAFRIDYGIHLLSSLKFESYDICLSIYFPL